MDGVSVLLDADIDVAALRRVTDGIREDVGERLIDAIAVGEDDETLGRDDVDRMPIRERLHAGADLFEQRHQVEVRGGQIELT